MGITIDSAIRDLIYLKGCGIFPFNYRTDTKQLTIATDECVVIAIETMRKYQRIQEIINIWSNDTGKDNLSGEYYLRDIREVIKDGNDS